MGVYIKGMEMPTEGYIDVRIKCNGTASFAIANNPYFKAVEAVPVPPHGRLIDADAILGKINAIISAHPDEADLYEQDAVIVRDWLRSEPTIIEAEEGET